MKDIQEEKLDIHAWVKEYIKLLDKQDKLDEFITSYDERIDIRELKSSDAKRELAEFIVTNNHPEDISKLYFDYLQDKTIIHLVDPEED
jgi:hypothetical protein